MKKQKSTSQAITSKKPYHSPTFKDEGHVNNITNSAGSPNPVGETVSTRPNS